MERPRPRHYLISPLLLLGLLAGAAATIGADAQPCESTNLATQIALFCASGLPTAPCCEPVVASVDRGGGVPCLCRVAAQPQVIFVSLKASHLISLYLACGGLYADGAYFAAAACLGSPPLAIPVIAPPPPAVPLIEQQSCTPPSNVPIITPPEAVPLRKQQTRSPPFTIPVIALPPAVPHHEQQSPGTPPSNVPGIISAPAIIPLQHQQTSSPPPSVVSIIPVRLAVSFHKLQTGFKCNFTLLAIELTNYCRDDMKVPSPRCCRNVLITIDDEDRDCLCRVTETGAIMVSDFLDVRVMWDLYRQCGGRRQAIPKDRDNCAHAPPPPPPSPPQLAPPPPVPKMHNQVPNWAIVVIVVVSVLVIAPILIEVARLVWKVKSTKAEENHDQEENESEENHDQEENESEEEESSEALQARQQAHQLAWEWEVNQYIEMMPKRVSPHSQPEKQKVRDREAHFNYN